MHHGKKCEYCGHRSCTMGIIHVPLFAVQRTCSVVHMTWSVDYGTCSMEHRACSLVHRSCSMANLTCSMVPRICCMVHRSHSTEQHMLLGAIVCLWARWSVGAIERWMTGFDRLWFNRLWKHPHTPLGNGMMFLVAAARPPCIGINSLSKETGCLSVYI